MTNLSLQFPWVMASDHGGFHLKRKLCALFPKIRDVGTDTEASCDYPDYVPPLVEQVLHNHAKGLLLCRSGLGMAIAANRFHGIRACLCRTANDVRLAREHNDMNVLVIGANETRLSEVLEWIFIAETQKSDLRHQNRLKKVDLLIQKS